MISNCFSSRLKLVNVLKPLLLVFFVLFTSAILFAGAQRHGISDLAKDGPYQLLSYYDNKAEKTTRKGFQAGCRSDLDYSSKVIVFDAGSTGTRLHIFTLVRQDEVDAKYNSINGYVVSELSHQKTYPGVTDYKDDINKLDLHLHDLLKFAEREISACVLINTPIYFYATAGMRLLSPEKAQLIFEKINTLLYERGHQDNLKDTRTLNGNEEAFLAWLSVNYAHRYFHTEYAYEPSVILDLGGASSQVALAVPGCEDIVTSTVCSGQDEKFTVTINNRPYNVHTESILKSGNKEFLAYLKRENETNPEVLQPCFPSGHDANSEFDFSKCWDVISKALTKFQSRSYDYNSNIREYIASAIAGHQKIIGISSFSYVFNNCGASTINELKASTIDNCGKGIDRIKQILPKESSRYFKTACFDSMYIQVTLGERYGIPSNYPDFMVGSIEDDHSWVLGVPVKNILTWG